MSTIFFSESSDFLGNVESRYFTKGFKNINIEFLDIYQKEGRVVESDISISSIYDALKQKGHLGAIECIVIACTLSEYYIINRTDLPELSKTRITQMKFQAKSAINTSENTIVKAMASLVKDYSDDDPSITIITQIDNITVQLTYYFVMDTLGSSSRRYKDIYKNKVNHLSKMNLDTLTYNCDAEVSLKPEFSNLEYSESILLTDVISICGQMIQMLLYSIENIKRQDANNLWLRSAEVNIHQQEPSNPFQISPWNIHFDNFSKVKHSNRDWRNVRLTLNSRYVSGILKVTHVINEDRS